MASNIAGSISRLSSHLTANYLSSSGWLRQMTDPHAKPRNYAVVIMVIISSSSSNSVFLLQTVVLPIASGQERRNASNMIHRYSLCS
jgi:hypothetical protein